MTAEVGGVQPEALNAIWPHIEDLVVRALDEARGEYTLVEIYESILQGKMQLWVVSEGVQLLSVFVTEIIDYSQHRVCMIVLAAGENLKALLEQLSIVEAWAEELEADEVRVQGRRGWLRAMANQGYVEEYTVIGKQLRNRHAKSIH